MKIISNVDGYEFPQLLSNAETYIYQNNIKGISRLKFKIKILWHRFLANRKLKQTLRLKKCYYGPFKGEFGHVTAHTIPFLMYLHKKGVKITYCGMELHKPLMLDEMGSSIIDDFRPLRDFFTEVPPSSNSTIPPKDVQEEIDKFSSEAINSKLPFWNINNDFYYWFVHRNWIMEGRTYLYDLSKVYQTNKEDSCCIFPRSKGSASSHNNGEMWDYNELIKLLKPYFKKIYIAGHPTQSLSIEESEGVELCITRDNSKILEKCANSSLIITQHSGVNNLGEYTNTQVLIIYKGGNRVEDIGSMNNTLFFRKGLGDKLPLKFAFSEDEIVSFVKNHYKA